MSVKDWESTKESKKSSKVQNILQSIRGFEIYSRFIGPSLIETVKL